MHVLLLLILAFCFGSTLLRIARAVLKFYVMLLGLFIVLAVVGTVALASVLTALLPYILLILGGAWIISIIYGGFTHKSTKPARDLAAPMRPNATHPSAADSKLSPREVPAPRAPTAPSVIVLTAKERREIERFRNLNQWVLVDVPPQFQRDFAAQCQWLYNKLGRQPNSADQLAILHEVTGGHTWLGKNP
jgi:hypothetical protein